MHKLCGNSIPLILAMLFIFAGRPAFSADFENSLTLTAGTVFPKTPLNGARYRVEPNVTTDGFLTRTTIISDFGTFEAVGPGMLAVRLHEIEALAELETFESSEEFKKGAKESANEKWSSLKNLVDKPKETMAGAGEGITRFFNRAVRSTKTGLQKADDVIHDRVPGADQAAGAGARLPGASQSGPAASQQSKYIQAAEATGNVAVNILGFEDSRRKLAKQLRVDPYTSNPVLDEKLDEVTWSIFAGDLGVDIVTGLIPGGTLVSSSTMVTKWVWDTPPGDLRVEIERTLLAMGMKQETVDRLLRHRYYTLTMQAALTSYLQELQDVQGRATIMPLALSVTSVDQARFVVGTLMMISRYHKQFKPLRSIESAGTIIAHTSDDKMVVVAPADYLSWSETMDTFSTRSDFRGKKPVLYTAGNVSALARTMLEQRGWQVNQQSDLFATPER